MNQYKKISICVPYIYLTYFTHLTHCSTKQNFWYLYLIPVVVCYFFWLRRRPNKCHGLGPTCQVDWNRLRWRYTYLAHIGSTWFHHRNLVKTKTRQRWVWKPSWVDVDCWKHRGKSKGGGKNFVSFFSKQRVWNLQFQVAVRDQTLWWMSARGSRLCWIWISSPVRNWWFKRGNVWIATFGSKESWLNQPSPPPSAGQGAPNNPPSLMNALPQELPDSHHPMKPMKPMRPMK